MSNAVASGSHATQEKIIEMLGVGITPVQVASACGVTESYVSQLLADEEIAERVRTMRVEKATAYIEHDSSLDAQEKRALELIAKNLQMGFLKPMEALKHFQVLNAARRKADATGGTQTPTSTVVNLNLPESATVQFKLTVDKQVIEVDGRSMAAMPAQNVARMMREKKARDMLADSRTLENGGVGPLKLNTPSILDTI